MPTPAATRGIHLAALAAASLLASAALLPHAAAQDSSDQPPSDQPGSPTLPPAPAAPPPPQAGAANDAVELLSKSSQTIAGAGSLAFTLTVRAEGFLAQHGPSLTARVLMVRRPGNDDWTIRITGSGKISPSAPEQNFDASWQPGFIEWLDHAQRTLRRQPGRPRGPDLSPALYLKQEWLMGPRPWTREMASADNAQITGQDTVNEADCRIIELRITGASGGKRRISIAEADMVPRRYEQLVEGQFQGSTIFDITQVQLTEPIAPEATRVAAPEGYAVEPEPATAPPPVAAATPAVPAAPPVATETEPSAPPAPVNRPAPGFELKTQSGESVSLESLQGRVAVLVFWGTWSLPSRDALPELARLADRFKEQPVSLLGLSVREKDPGAGAALLAERNAAFRTLLNADATAAAYGVRTYPTFVVVDAEGQIVETVEGFPKGSNLDALAERIAEEAAEAPAQAPQG